MRVGGMLPLASPLNGRAARPSPDKMPKTAYNRGLRISRSRHLDALATP